MFACIHSKSAAGRSQQAEESKATCESSWSLRVHPAILNFVTAAAHAGCIAQEARNSIRATAIVAAKQQRHPHHPPTGVRLMHSIPKLATQSFPTHHFPPYPSARTPPFALDPVSLAATLPRKLPGGGSVEANSAVAFVSHLSRILPHVKSAAHTTGTWTWKRQTS